LAVILTLIIWRLTAFASQSPCKPPRRGHPPVCQRHTTKGHASPAPIRFIYLRNKYSAMKVLFICNCNQNRSKTAEELFKSRFETRSAGIYNNPLKETDLIWADVVVVMEDWQRGEIGKIFPKQYMKKKILSANIPDVYRYNDPELIGLLKSRISQLAIS
jgi:predicted protein tyrosine phosphatase